MAGPALAILEGFRSVEDDQKYTRLVDLFADDAVYYDPFFGPQRGPAEIRTFMEHMEKVVPGSGARFANWHIEADTNCAWADWDMVAPDANGVDVPVPGQSLYRLRDGEVTFVADYVDRRAYRRLRGADAPDPDHVASLGLSKRSDNPRGAAHDVLSAYWAMQQSGRADELASLFRSDAQCVSPTRGTFTGRAEIDGFMKQMAVDMPAAGASFTLVDLAADDTVAWAQWWFHLPGGDVPGWDLFTVRDGEITFSRGVVDMAALERVRAAS